MNIYQIVNILFAIVIGLVIIRRLLKEYRKAKQFDATMKYIEELRKIANEKK